MRRPSGLFLAILILLAAAACALYFRCWREVARDNPVLGRIVYRYVRCELTGMTFDSDRDGTIDIRLRVASSDNIAGSTGFKALEGWESVDRDGVFNLHFYYDDSVLVAELDRNKDGSYEQVMRGDAAEAWLREKQYLQPGTVE